MFLSYLHLNNFRSYEIVELELAPGITSFIGSNGEGKTNIIEAVGFLAYLRSHRTSSDNPLVKLGEEKAYIRAKVESEGRTELLEVEINQGKANRARINQQPVRSTRELLGHVRAVLFTPEDLALVKGDPNERRDFLDTLLISLTPRYAGVIADYEKALKQRNVLLKSRPHERDLAPWDEHISRYGAQLIAARLQLVKDLLPFVIESYKDISSGDSIGATYKSAQDLQGESSEELQEEIAALLPSLRRAELDRGVTLVGPHRDDLSLTLGPTPVKGYASQGESWSFALALRMGAYRLLRGEMSSAVGGSSEPILILDDVFAELDSVRRAALLELIESSEQVLVTAAVEDDLPKAFADRRLYVREGKVSAR
ncbi:MAG: DNA replication/repair protein RecF [Actinobacteria bacterium]|nr:DNA replication/repair protein RecF [Actinomycetota bacterium]